MNVPMLFYHPDFNVIRLLHPSGKVEVLNLSDNCQGKEWFKSYFTTKSYDDSREWLSREHELIGLV